MSCCLPTKCRMFVAVLTVALLPTSVSRAQSEGYRPPNFSGMAMQAGGGAQQMQNFPPAFLAGGPAAAQGGEFMDVQGRQIQLSNYCQSCPGGDAGGYGGGGGGYGGYCPPCGDGGGNPMAVDFGGYGQDQCGPHYFDFQVGAVFMQIDDAFGGGGAFTSIGRGVNAPRVLDGSQGGGDFQPGWEIGARYDIGALAVLEASYLGVYDLGFSESVSSPDVAPGGANFQLFSPFSNFGTVAPDIAGIDNGQRHSLDYQADLQSTEFNYRRYWVGHRPRFSGTFLVGFHYLRFTDDVTFNSTGLVGAVPDETAQLQWGGENDLVGAHFGGDGWVCLRQGLRMGIEGTAGIYNNRYKFNSSAAFSAPTAPAGFTQENEGNHVAFASQLEASIIADIWSSWSIRTGYRLMFIDSLVTGSGNINQTNLTENSASPDANLLLHGFHAGVEYVW